MKNINYETQINWYIIKKCNTYNGKAPTECFSTEF